MSFTVVATGGLGLSALAFDASRRLLATSARDGRVLVEDNGALAEWTNTGGTPVGLAVDGATVLVADAAHGAILSLSDEGVPTVRAERRRAPRALQHAAPDSCQPPPPPPSAQCKAGDLPSAPRLPPPLPRRSGPPRRENPSPFRRAGAALARV